MKISDREENGKPIFSFEIFPPKKTSPIETIYRTLDELQGLSPDFISVTYGAGGGKNTHSTCKIAKDIREIYGIESVAHLTCINNTKEDILKILDEFKANGISNILALRGDVNPDYPIANDFKYASDLVKFIKENGDFCIMGACYPETHLEAPDAVTDIINLKKKIDAGVSHLISQLFFDNESFYLFREKLAIAGINVPVEAGIMPVTNRKQIERMVSLCGASLPRKFSRIMQRYENNPEALRDAGIAYAVDQIVDLLSSGVDGIHLYTMNNPYVAKKITESIAGLLK